MMVVRLHGIVRKVLSHAALVMGRCGCAQGCRFSPENLETRIVRGIRKQSEGKQKVVGGGGILFLPCAEVWAFISTNLEQERREPFFPVKIFAGR